MRNFIKDAYFMGLVERYNNSCNGSYWDTYYSMAFDQTLWNG